MKRCTYPYCGKHRSECEMCRSSLREATGPVLLAATFALAFAIVAIAQWVWP